MTSINNEDKEVEFEERVLTQIAMNKEETE